MPLNIETMWQKFISHYTKHPVGIRGRIDGKWGKRINCKKARTSSKGGIYVVSKRTP